MAEHRHPERTTTLEELRLDEAREKGVPWKQWGPYLSERQWGTVREDYNTWSWWPDQPKPFLREVKGGSGVGTIAASRAELGNYSLHCEGDPRLLFTENDTNNERLFGTPNATP